MAISVGQTLRDASLLQVGCNGPEAVPPAFKLHGRRFVIFGEALPAAI